MNKRFRISGFFLIAVIAMAGAGRHAAAEDQGYRYQYLGINGWQYLGEALCDSGLRYAPPAYNGNFDSSCYWRTPGAPIEDRDAAYQIRAGVCRRSSDSRDGFNPGTVVECGDISDMNLAGAQRQGQSLIGMKAFRTNFSGANFSGANLHELQAYQANMNGANFLYANFWNARLDAVQAVGALFNGTHFVVESGFYSDVYVGNGAHYFGVSGGGNFQDAHFNEAYVKLQCDGCNLRNADFYNLQVDHGNPSELNLRGSDARGISLMRANVMIHCILSDLRGAVSASEAHVYGVGSPYFEACNLSDGNFSGSSMQYVQFINSAQDRTLARNVNFSNSDLQMAIFRAADFRGANFQNTNLQYSWLSTTDFTAANFTGANLADTYLGFNNQCSDFRGANFAQTNLHNSHIPRACLSYFPLTESAAVGRGMIIL